MLVTENFLGSVEWPAGSMDRARGWASSPRTRAPCLFYVCPHADHHTEGASLWSWPSESPRGESGAALLHPAAPHTQAGNGKTAPKTPTADGAPLLLTSLLEPLSHGRLATSGCSFYSFTRNEMKSSLGCTKLQNPCEEGSSRNSWKTYIREKKLQRFHFCTKSHFSTTFSKSPCIQSCAPKCPGHPEDGRN